MIAWINAHGSQIALGCIGVLLILAAGLGLSCVIGHQELIETEAERDKRRRG